MLSSFKLYIFIALIAFTFAKKHLKDAKTSCPTTCNNCAENQMCSIFSDETPAGFCAVPECIDYDCRKECTGKADCSDVICGIGERCETVMESCLFCAHTVCVPNDQPCAACTEPKKSCDSCRKNEICIIASKDGCDCPEPRCEGIPEF